MADEESKHIPEDIPDPGKLQKHGVSIDAPTPTKLEMLNPWSPSGDGATARPDAGPPAGEPGSAAPERDPLGGGEPQQGNE